MDFSNGINAPKENYGKGRKMISVMDILSPNFLSYENIRNSVSVSKQIEEKNKVEKGDIVFVRSSEVPEEVGWAKAYLDSDYALYSGFSIRGKKKNQFDAIFFEHSLNSVGRKQIEKKAGGSTRFNISQQILNSITIIVPSFEEQIKIGNFFKQLDRTITLHQEKLDKLEHLKKGFMQVMFPQNGEEVPRLRFADFDGKWEQRKFSDLVVRISKSSDKEVLPRVEYEDIISGQGELNKDIFSKESNKKGIEFESGDTLFGKLRPYLKNWILADFKGIAVGDWWVLRPNERDNKFIYSLIQSNKYQTVANLSTGTKMPRSDWKVVSQTVFAVPINIDEQSKIGQFFSNLDHIIALHQTKLDKLQILKKAYLQKMFI